MFNWLKHFQLEKISFFIGFLTSTVLWLIFSYSKKWFPSITEFFKSTMRQIRQQQLSGIIIAVNKYALEKAQNNHLANHLFSHSEISIKPKLYALKQDIRLETENIFTSEAENIIPYSPDSPFLARNFYTPDLTLAEALQAQANIVITGIPGIGKSFMLADLVISICLNNSESGSLINKTPIYFDIQDINETFLNKESESKLEDVLFNILDKKLNTLNKSRLQKFTESAVQENEIILVIDGFDLLTKNEFDRYQELIISWSETYPELQFVLTATNYWGKLERHNFIPLAVRPFSNQETDLFINRWITLWYSEIFPLASEEYFIKPIIKNWLLQFNQPLTKLELTLLIWGALEGQIRGGNTLSLFENYFIKVLGNNFNREKLGQILHEYFDKNSSYLTSGSISNHPLVSTLIENGVVENNQENRVYFKHPDFLGFLASFYNFDSASQFNKEEVYFWSSLFSYYGFKVSRDTNSSLADHLISEDSPPVFQNLLFLGNWLRHTSPKSAFRMKLIKKLVPIIQNNNAPFSIRLRLLSVFAFANDSSGVLFLKQLLNSNNEEVKSLAALAAGIFPSDYKIIPELINALNTKSLFLQKTVCLALTTFNHELAIHTLGKMFLSADENIRKLIAENFAYNENSGHEILKDAMTMDDILVRRSALFGLIRINQPWASELIEHTSIQDSQWVVRNVAAQAIEISRNLENKLIPYKPKPYFEDPWLIEFSSGFQKGVTEDIPPQEMLLKAITDENPENKIHALMMISRNFDQSFYSEIYRSIFSKNREISQYAVTCLINIICSGESTPDPIKFGMF